MRWTWGLAVLAALATSCADDAGAPAPTTTSAAVEPATSAATPSTSLGPANASSSATTTIAPAALPGAGFAVDVQSWEWGDETWSPPPATAEGEVALAACRWTGPGLYEAELVWNPADETSVAGLPVSVNFWIGDQGVGGESYVSVRGAGNFVVPVDVGHQLGGFDDREWTADHHVWAREQRRECVADVVFDDGWRSMSGVVLEIAPPPPDPGADISTVEGRVASMDLVAGDDPLLALAYLLALPDRPDIDRLLVLDIFKLDSIQIEREGTCLDITSFYDRETEAPYTVRQRRGCSIHFADSEGDEAWRASVPEFVRPQARWLNFEGVVPFDPVGRDLNAHEWLAAWRADFPGRVVLGSFDWQNGLVAVVDNAPDGVGHTVERYGEPLVITPLPFNAGGAGSGCEAYGWHRSSNDAAGYLIAVAERPGLTFEFEPELQLEWKPALPTGGVIGFADISGMPDPRLVEVRDAAGNPVECVQ